MATCALRFQGSTHVIDDRGKRQAREMSYRKKTHGRQRGDVWRGGKKGEKAIEAGCGG